MSSYYYGGSIRMNPEVETEDRILPDHYPYQLPKVYIEGKGKRNHKWTQYDWGDDSVVEIRDKHIARYTRTAFAEMLVENKRGESVWVNSKNAASFSWFDEENIKDIRGAFEYKVEEYDLEKFEKRTYKVLLDETSTFCVDDYYDLSPFLDYEDIGNHFDIKDGVLHMYIGMDNDIVIPEGVIALAPTALGMVGQCKSITIPQTLINIPNQIPESCEVDSIIVEEGNPKYYTNNGCLIDKETNTLIWGYSGNTIPDDGSVTTIATNAYANRFDLESIIIPNSVTKIASDAFYNCVGLKKIIFPDTQQTAVVPEYDECNFDVVSNCSNVDDTMIMNAFGWPLVRIDGRWRIDKSKISVFSF